jgi:hypothetical protein
MCEKSVWYEYSISVCRAADRLGTGGDAVPIALVGSMLLNPGVVKLSQKVSCIIIS